MSIEQATIEDAEAILDLQRLAYQSEAEIYDHYSIPPLTQSLKEFEKEFHAKLYLKALAADQSIIGSVRAHLDRGTCFIGRLVVNPTHQNQGVGAALMWDIERRFQEAERYELFTGHRSERNLHLYTKLGYQVFRKERISDRLVLVYMEKLSLQPNGDVSCQKSKDRTRCGTSPQP